VAECLLSSSHTKESPAYYNKNKQGCGLGGADFWIFWIFNLRQPAADVKCYSKTKVEKAFFFISCHSLRK
jgi:hypothetical protein